MLNAVGNSQRLFRDFVTGPRMLANCRKKLADYDEVLATTFDFRKLSLPLFTPTVPGRFQSAADMADSNETILFETSPYGNLDAIVEHDHRVVYFYLNGRSGEEDRFGTRACWVRNLVRGPLTLSESEMKQGIPPLLPRVDCKSSEPGELPAADSLRIVWFEEGNGAALIETRGGAQETISVIPPWSGVDGFHGYASQCVHESPLCWPLPENQRLARRIANAEEFWQSFTPQSSPFLELQPRLLRAYSDLYGDVEEGNYFSIDGGKFPPRGLVRFNLESEIVLLTVGMSMCPQPATELFVENPPEFRRVELGAAIPISESLESVDAAIRSLGSLAFYPWKNWTWLGPGHSLEWARGKAVLTRNDSLVLPEFRGDPVHALWLGS